MTLGLKMWVGIDNQNIVTSHNALHIISITWNYEAKNMKLKSVEEI